MNGLFYTLLAAAGGVILVGCLRVTPEQMAEHRAEQLRRYRAPEPTTNPGRTRWTDEARWDRTPHE